MKKLIERLERLQEVAIPVELTWKEWKLYEPEDSAEKANVEKAAKALSRALKNAFLKMNKANELDPKKSKMDLYDLGMDIVQDVAHKYSKAGAEDTAVDEVAGKKITDMARAIVNKSK